MIGWTRHLMLCVLMFSSQAYATEMGLRTISVTGTSMTHAPTDTVVWHVQTTSVHRNLVQAKEDSDKQMRSILKTARGLGVKDEDMQTGYLRAEKRYEYDDSMTYGAFKDFSVTRHITIKERDPTQFDQFFSALVKSSDIEVHYTLESSKIHDIQVTTRLKSVQMAKEKAEMMAKELGAELGSVLILEEQQLDPYGYPYSRSHMTLNSSSDALMPAEASFGTFAPGSIEVTTSVKVTFELKDKD